MQTIKDISFIIIGVILTVLVIILFVPIMLLKLILTFASENLCFLVK